MRKAMLTVGLAVLVLAGDAVLRAASTTMFTVLPAMVTNTVGVPLDPAPGFDHGSLKATGTAKSETYFTPESQLNGRAITLGEIADISYFTKKGTDHVSSTGDWFLAIYTKPYSGDVSPATWYGDRIGSEPYFAQNLTEVVGGWNQWSATDTTNQLRWFESTLDYFGSYTDPDLSTFLAGNALSGQPYATREVLAISVQTASTWGIGFEGQVDGLRVALTDGTVMKFNFEPFVVVSDRDSCKLNGWQTQRRANGSGFTSQGECVSYVQTGK